jgi:VWFA-related protein
MRAGLQATGALLCGAFLVSAQPIPQAPSPLPSPIPTLRITVTLVQIDAVVTDSRGRHVMDLSPGDFELLQDQEPRAITFFSTAPGPTRLPHVADQPDREPLPITSKPLSSPAQVMRVIGLVVDDLALTFENLVRTRDALKRYVETQMQPGDVVGIVRTGGGIAILEQFTTDKRILLEAIANFRWRFSGRQGIGTISPQPQRGTSRPEFIESGYTLSVLGALGTVEQVIEGMKRFPGRKSVVFFSDDLRADGSVNAAIDQLTDLANRSMVSIYAVDPGGLRAGAHLVQRGDVAVVARDSDSADRFPDSSATESADEIARQEGLAALASHTGGIFYHNRNDIDACIAEAADDQSGYYLLGYSPTEGSFGQNGHGKFHRLTLHVKRPGLKVRWKTGFNGVLDQLMLTDTATAPQSREQELLDALASPFTATGIKVKLTSTYAESSKYGPVVYSMLHLDGKDLTFHRDEDNGWLASLDVVWSAYRGMRKPIWQGDKVQNIRLSESDYRKALQDGLTLPFNIRAEFPGTFLLRTVVRDAGSMRLGSASQYIDVPDTRKGTFGMSGISLTLAPQEVLTEIESLPLVNQETWTQGGPAIRRYLPGQAILYAYMIINPAIRGSDKKSGVTSHIRVFRDGKLIYTGAESDSATPLRDDPTKLVAGGVLRLGDRLTPGEYLLQVIVRDDASSRKAVPMTQWIDFEVVSEGRKPIGSQ